MQYNVIETSSNTLSHAMYVSIGGRIYVVGTLRGAFVRDGKKYTKGVEDRELAKPGGSLQWLNEMPGVLSDRKQEVKEAKLLHIGDVVTIKYQKGKFKIVKIWNTITFVEVQ